MSLKGKVTVVLGASGTVGSGIARKIADEGATVAVVSRREEGLEKIKKYLKGKESQLFTFVADVAKVEGAAKFRDAILAKYNKIDHVFSSIGGWDNSGPITTLTYEQVQKAFQTYTLSHWSVAKAFLGNRKEEDTGLTIITGGAGGFVIDINASVVTTAVAGLFGLSLALRKEFEKTKARVNELRIQVFVKEEGQAGGSVLDHRDIGKVAVNIAKSTARGKLILINNKDDINQSI